MPISYCLTSPPQGPTVRLSSRAIFLLMIKEVFQMSVDTMHCIIARIKLFQYFFPINSLNFSKRIEWHGNVVNLDKKMFQCLKVSLFLGLSQSEFVLFSANFTTKKGKVKMLIMTWRNQQFNFYIFLMINLLFSCRFCHDGVHLKYRVVIWTHCFHHLFGWKQ